VDGVTYASPGVFLGNVSLTVRGGERVGVTGLRGSGATTLARIVAGAATIDVGQVRLGGYVLRPGDRAGALRAGIGYIPEDRQADGFVPLLGAAENISMTITDRIARFGFIAPKRREARAAPLARRLSLVSAGLGQPVRELSGGNQQKVTVARALASDPVLIVAITPTRGVDVASKELLLAELDRITTETGASLLLASDELDDLVICDRVVVFVRGEIFTEFTEPPFDREALIAATEGLGAT
jgi:simple sugar transport system ATP-binding protein